MGVDVIGGGLGRLVTKPLTAGQFQVGTVTLNSTSGTTAWGQVTASLAAETVITKVYLTSTGNPFDTGIVDTVEVGVGGSGSEVSLTTEPIPVSSATGAALWAVVALSVPVRVPAGQRVALRMSNPGGPGSVSVVCAAYGAPWSSLDGN